MDNEVDMLSLSTTKWISIPWQNALNMQTLFKEFAERHTPSGAQAEVVPYFLLLMLRPSRNYLHIQIRVHKRAQPPCKLGIRIKKTVEYQHMLLCIGTNVVLNQFCLF